MPEFRIIDEASSKRPVYCYRAERECPIWPDTVCGLETNTRESQLWCQECSAEHEWTAMRRVLGVGVSMAQVWHEGYNPAVGKVVSDHKQFVDELKRAGDEASERMGYSITYGEHGPGDAEALGVTDEGLDSTHDEWVRRGWKESKGRFVTQMPGEKTPSD